MDKRKRIKLFRERVCQLCQEEDSLSSCPLHKPCKFYRLGGKILSIALELEEGKADGS